MTTTALLLNHHIAEKKGKKHHQTFVWRMPRTHSYTDLGVVTFCVYIITSCSSLSFNFHLSSNLCNFLGSFRRMWDNSSIVIVIVAVTGSHCTFLRGTAVVIAVAFLHCSCFVLCCMMACRGTTTSASMILHYMLRSARCSSSTSPSLRRRCCGCCCTTCTCCLTWISTHLSYVFFFDWFPLILLLRS